MRGEGRVIAEAEVKTDVATSQGMQASIRSWKKRGADWLGQYSFWTPPPPEPVRE